MKTSYFARLKYIKYPISIALFTPTWARIPQYSKLAPTNKLLDGFKNNSINTIEYTNIYFKEVLDKLNPETVVSELCALHPNALMSDLVLICYEKPEIFCYRHLVAGWLNHNLNLGIKELEI